MIDNLLGGDDEDGPDETADDMDGGLFEGDEGGDDPMGGDDDLMGGSDDLMGGDGMGFDEMDDDGAATSAEMDNRIEELENEVASLSSTVNTVKSENEQISESVEDVEENIRKLLEVYEMVTRGVNPFVDENEMGNAFDGGGGGSMELFGDGEEEEETEIDDSVADADADEFFDDDLDDDLDDGDEFDDFDDGDADGRDDGDADGRDDGDEFDDFEDGDELDGDGDGGKSFEELKAEYDSGDANWDEGDEPTDDAFADGDSDGGDGIDDTPIGGEDLTEGAADDDATPVESGGGSGSPVEGGKPYLDTLPAGYVADIVVMDWLEFLVDEAGVDGAARTVAYYEAIDWLDEPAAETLQTFLDGFGGGAEPDPEPQSSLTVDHHNRSLRFISRIANPDMEMVAFDERGSNRIPREPKPGAGSEPESSRGERLPDGTTTDSGPGMESDGGRTISDSAGEPPEFGADPATESGFYWYDGRTE